MCLNCKKKVESQIQTLKSQSTHAQAVIDSLFQKPSINVQKAKAITRQSLPSAYKLISHLEQLGILQEITGTKRDKLYLFKEYIELFR